MAPPRLQPPIGMTAEEQRDELREKFNTVEKGATATIPDELETAYRYLCEVEAYIREQKILITNQMRVHAGTAQTVINSAGQPVAKRRRYWVPEQVHEAHWVDGYWPTSNTRAGKS